MVRISLVPALTPLYLYVSTFRSMCAVPNMAVFCSSLTSENSHIGHCTNIIIIIIIIINGNVYPRTGHRSPEGERRCSSTLSLSSALDGGVWSTLLSGQFSPGKETRYPLYGRLDGPQGRSGRVRKISLPPGFNTQTVQSIASRYAHWLSRHIIIIITFIKPANVLTFINSQSASPLDISAGTPCEIYNYIYYIIITMTIIIKIGIAAPLNSALPVGSIQPQLHPPPIPTPCFILRANLVFPTQVHVAKEIATWPPQFNPLNPELNPICYLLALL